MKKHLQHLLLLAAFLLPLASQAQVDLTVHDGTATDSYVPIYGYYADAYLNCQMVYPAAELVQMTGGQISSLTFYASTAGGWSSSSFQVYVGEVASTTINAFEAFTNLTMVFQGPLSGGATTNTITFTTPYNYTGGNLLVAVVNATAGNYSSCSWAGETVTGASFQGYSYSDVASCSGSQKNFLPKTTFSYAPGQQACPLVSHFHYDNLTATSVDLAWTPGGTEAEWEIYISPAVEGDSLFYATDTTYAFTNLSGNTSYRVKCRAICGTDTAYAASVSFRTPCVPLTSEDLPYTEGFESYNSGTTAAIDPCWHKAVVGSTTQYPYPYATNAITGNRSLYFYSNATSVVSYATLPQLASDLAANTLQLSFNARRYSSTSSTYGSMIMVGVMTDPADITTFDTIAVVNLTAEAPLSIHNIEVPLNSYNDTGAYIALYAPNPTTYSYNYIYIDDISLDVLPTCIRPGNLVASDVQSEEVTLTWQAGNDETSWIVTYGTNEELVNDTTFTATELDPNTLYTFTVRSYCGVDDTSTAAIITVRTECGQTALPYNENFDAMTAGSGNGPLCWTYMGPSSASCVYINTSNSHSSPNSLGFYSGERYIATPRIPVPANMIGLSFWLKAESTTSSGTMKLGYVTDPTAPIDSIHWIQTIQPSNTNWIQYEYELTDLDCTDTVYLVFHQDYNSSYYYYWLDDLEIFRLSSCPRPEVTSVRPAADEATIAFNGTTDASYYIYINDTLEFFPTESPYTMTGLEPNTEYSGLLYTICSTGDSSTARAFSFRTACLPIDSLPYFEGFEDYTAATTAPISTCWRKGYFNGSSWTATNYPYPSTTAAATGTKSLYFYSYYYYPYYCYAALPLFNDSLADLQVSFKLRAGSISSSYINSLQVGVMTDPEDITTFTPIDTYTATSNTTWDSFCVYLAAYQGTGRYIAFKSTLPDGSSSYYNYVFLDDVTVDHVPNCGPVTDVEVAVSTNSALVSWNQSVVGEYTGATVEYREAGDSTATWTTLSTTNETMAITGLTATTAYDVRVQNLCSDEEGQWVYANFTTGSYVCVDFDTTSTASDTIGNGTTTNSYLPTYSLYDYALSQQIYREEDFDITSLGGVITKIGFQLSTTPNARNWKIYVSTTDQSDLSGGFIPVSANDLVWQGSTTTLNGSGWNEIELTTPMPVGNILVTFQDITGNYNSGNYGVVTNTGISAISRYIYRDGTPYDPTGTIAGGTATSDRLNMYFVVSECEEQTTCSAPILTGEATAIDEIDLAWVPGNTETSWHVYYRTAADTAFTLATTATTNSYSFTNLQPSTHYFFKVVSVCGSDEGGAATFDCWTECGLTPIPFFEDFESEDFGPFSRTCWKSGTIQLGTTYPYPYIVSLSGDPNKLCLLYNGAYLVLPEFNAQLNTLQARFTFLQGSDNIRLMVGLLPSLDAPISSIMPIDTLIRSEIDPDNQSVVVTLPFDMLDDSTRGHIVFYDAWNDNYSFIDNLNIETIPSCSSITGVAVSNITTNSADVTWTEGGLLATSYLVEYGPHHFEPGTGTTMSVATNSVSLTGLAVGTTYDVYVYAVCSLSGDTSFASNVAVFATECGALTLPYTENFDNVLEPGSGSSTKQLPNCWHYVMTNSGYSSTSYYPTAYQTTSVGYTTSGEYCLWLYGEAITVLPEMPTTVDSLMITFHEKNTSTSYQLIVGAVDSITPGFDSSFVGLDTITTTGNFTLFLNNYTGTGRYIAFKNINTSGYGYSYHYIDDIVVDRIPSCIYPMNFSTAGASTTTADIAWTTSNATDYEYEYGVTGFTRGTGTTGTCQGQLASITGLTISTTYDIYVRGICAPGDTSAWSMYTFNTLNADPAALPYSCDFTDTTMMNAGFEFVNGTNNVWYVGNATYNATPNSLYITNDNGASNAYNTSGVQISYAYRDVVVPGGECAYSFDWKAQGESSWDYLRVWLAPVGVQFTAGQLPDGSNSTYNYVSSNPAGWIPLDDGSKLNLQTTWQTKSGEVVVPAGTYHLVFMWGNDGSGGSQPPAAIDNIVLVPNTCPKVQNLQASNIAATTMDITWTDTVAGLGYDVEYGPAGFAHGDPTAISAFTTQTNYTMTGLTALTPYDVYVRHICSATDTGMWTKISVQSAMCDNANTVITYGDTTASAMTSSYSIGYSFYKYSYTETIIDSAEMAGMNDEITAFAFHPASITSGSFFTNCDVYLGHTTASSFTSTPLYDTNFVLVYSGDLSYTTDDWQIHGFDTPFTWDGHSNVVLVVNRKHGAYSSGATFHAHSTTTAKTYYRYTDSYALTPGTTDGYGDVENDRADIQLIACAASCPAPVITSVNQTYESATITWSGSGDNYEVDYRTLDGTYGTPVAVAGTTYTINGLAPATSYMFRVRTDCTADSNDYSNWVETNFTTDSMPCFAPTNFHSTDVTNSTASFAWTPGSTETAWEIHVFNSTFDQTYEVNTNPATVNGLTTGVTYSAAIRSLCGSEHGIIGEYGDTIQFTTAICDPVTNVTATASGLSITVTWTPGANNCGNFEIEYGEHGFGQGEGTTVAVSGNSKTFNGLEELTQYDFYVRAVCADGWTSAWSSLATATTGQATGDECYAPTNVSATANGTSITFTWNAATGNTGDYEVEYGQAGFSHGQGTTAQISDESFTVNDLAAATTYDFYVRALCTNQNYSDWSDKATATTGQIGIYDVDGSFNCTIFPNPATDETTISVSGVNGQVTISVVDMNGRTVSAETLDCAADCEKKVNVSGLAQGAYFVRIFGNNVNSVKKLIVR